MPLFSYKAVSSDGKHSSGVLEGIDTADVSSLLREQGLFVLSIAPCKKKKQGNVVVKYFEQRVSKEELAATVRQIATLLRAGIPLDEVLATIAHSEGQPTKLQKVLSEIKDSVRGGEDFSQVLHNYPHVFDNIFVTMVQAGEQSGSLEIVMERLADHADAAIALRRKFQTALAYPILMGLIGLGVIIFLLLCVLPKVTEVFFDLDQALPLPTQILLAITDILTNFWHVMGVVCIGAVICCYRLSKTAKGEKIFHKMQLCMPVFGPLYRDIAIENFTKTLGTLLKNGVPVVSALTIVQNITKNIHIKEMLRCVLVDVQEGKSFSTSLNKANILPYASIQTIAAGEHSGRLAEMLILVAKDRESKITNALQMLTSLLEPLMIVVLGAFVGFVVLAIMLPIFQMSSMVG